MDDLMSSVISLCERHIEKFIIRNNQIVAQYCPYCGGGENKDKETFAVNMHNGAFNCKRGSCGVTGSFKDLCNHFGERYTINVSAPFIQPKKSFDKPDPDDLMPLTDEIITYFAMRKISRDTLDAFKIQSDANGNIVFPFYKDGVLLYEKFRKPVKFVKGSGVKEWQLKNTQAILFGMDNVSLTKPLYITEGQIDALSLYEAGIHNVVSVPSGVNNMEWINYCWDWLDNFSEIILFGDNDEPGIEMVNTLMKRLGEDRCMIIKDYPDLVVNEKIIGRTCKDANEILYCYGEEKLREVAAGAEPAPIKGVIDLATIPYIDPATQPRIYTRIPALDNMIGGLSEGGLTVCTGKRGDGKSTLSGQLMLGAIQQGRKVCAYSGELSAYKFSEWILMQACESKYVGVKVDENSGKRYSVLSPLIRDRINEWLAGNFYLFDNAYVSDEEQTKSILRVFTMCARRFGCSLFLVDNMLSSLSSSEEEEYKAQAKFTAALKNFAVKFKAHVILISHPRKTKSGETIVNDDISGSASITNLADNVLVAEKPNQRVIKNRDFGSTGLIYCDYDPANRRIYESAVGDRVVFGWNHEGIPLPDVQANKLPEFAIQSGIPASGPQPF